MGGLSDILIVAVRPEDSTQQNQRNESTDEKGLVVSRNSGRHKMDFCRGLSILPLEMSVHASMVVRISWASPVKQFPFGSNR